MKQRDVLHAFIMVALLVLGRWAIIPWFYASILFFLTLSFKKEGFSFNIAALLLYLIPLELLGRILDASPFVPYEAGKYTTFVVLVYGLLRIKVKKGLWVFIALILTVPGIIMVKQEVWLTELIFNLLGLINMLLAALLFINIKLTAKEVKRLIKLALYPVLVLLFYLIIVSPDVNSVDYVLGALDELTADFGSNQVSTVLGYGIVLLGFLYLSKWKFSRVYLGDQVLLLIITLWSLLSFSRGGVFGALFALGAVIAMNFFSKTKEGSRKINPASIVGVILALFISFYVGNTISNGALLLRYQGETEGTLAGAKEKDLNQLTTGRLNIVMRDFDIWKSRPLLGVGVANAKEVGRDEYDNDAIPHVEMSRLLAEHGLSGLGIIMLIYFYPFILMMREKGQLKRNWMMVFLLLSLFTTLHAATRTMISPVLFGLAFININEE